MSTKDYLAKITQPSHKPKFSSPLILDRRQQSPGRIVTLSEERRNTSQTSPDHSPGYIFFEVQRSQQLRGAGSSEELAVQRNQQFSGAGITNFNRLLRQIVSYDRPPYTNFNKLIGQIMSRQSLDIDKTYPRQTDWSDHVITWTLTRPTSPDHTLVYLQQ